MTEKIDLFDDENKIFIFTGLGLYHYFVIRFEEELMLTIFLYEGVLQVKSKAFNSEKLKELQDKLFEYGTGEFLYHFQSIYNINKTNENIKNNLGSIADYCLTTNNETLKKDLKCLNRVLEQAVKSRNYIFHRFLHKNIHIQPDRNLSTEEREMLSKEINYNIEKIKKGIDEIVLFNKKYFSSDVYNEIKKGLNLPELINYRLNHSAFKK